MNENPLSHILEYNLDLGKTKPDTVHRDEKYCPFCDVAHLKNVMEKRGPMIWLENAYPVLKDSWQTLIIESDDCDGEFSSYTPEYALKLIQFGPGKMAASRRAWGNSGPSSSTATTATCPAARIQSSSFARSSASQGLRLSPGYQALPFRRTCHRRGRRPDRQLVPAPHHRFLRSEPHPQGPGKAGEIRPLYAADGRLFMH